MLVWLRSKNVFWWLIIVAGLILIGTVVLSALLVSDAGGTLRWALYAKEYLEPVGLMPAIITVGSLMQDDAIYAITVGLLFSAISTATIYIFKVSSIRRVAIQAIAYGYFENFLIRLVQHCSDTYPHYRIVLIRPTFQLVEYPDFYMNEIKSRLEKLGFSTVSEMTDRSFIRNSIFVQRKDNPPIPLFIDIPTTLKTLKKILELEADMPTGKVVEHKWWKTRFYQLCRDFENAILQVLPANSWGNLVILESENPALFEKQLLHEIEALESEIGVSNNG